MTQADHIEPFLPDKPRGVPRSSDRKVAHGIYWRLRTRSPWADTAKGQVLLADRGYDTDALRARLASPRGGNLKPVPHCPKCQAAAARCFAATAMSLVRRGDLDAGRASTEAWPRFFPV